MLSKTFVFFRLVARRLLSAYIRLKMMRIKRTKSRTSRIPNGAIIEKTVKPYDARLNNLLVCSSVVPSPTCMAVRTMVM